MASMSTPVKSSALWGSEEGRIAAVRRFNRFYTQRIGVLTERYLGSSLSLAEVRILFELASRGQSTASELARELELDAGYLSRLLLHFRKRGWIVRSKSETDLRQRILRLTRKGRATFSPLNRQADQHVSSFLKRLPESVQRRLIECMGCIEASLTPAQPSMASILLRSPAPGDLGWVVQFHGALYAQEYAWDEHFEALVAEIIARFVRHDDPKRQRCWIAERDGQNVGCVFCVQQSKSIAQLRLLLVEPECRGMGVGTRLVAECVQFAKSAGYRKLVLWTNDVLHAARQIYQKAGFRLVREESHHSFGHDLVGQFWERTL